MSIVVISHNYERYLPAAIDSALAQDYDPVQVLVVDDGSTDDSQQVIRSYGDRVQAIFKPNEGNSTAINAAFPHCRGEIVMFLDADDYLYPNAVSRVVDGWKEGAAKLEFRLSLVDADGVRGGVEPPACAPLPNGDVVGEFSRWGHYVTPVLGGNAFSRAALEQLLPVPDEPSFRNHNDGYLNPLCAFCGPIASVDEELGAYRLHGTNQWAYTDAIDTARLHERLRHELVREGYLRDAANRAGRALPEALMLRNSVHVTQRLASLKLDPASHPVAGDRIWTLATALPRAVLRNPELSTSERLFTLFAGLLLAAAPGKLAGRPADWMLASRPRPRWLRALARTVRLLGGMVRPAARAGDGRGESPPRPTDER
ncbi:MAG: glycosyltransferase family 2 protein [Arthrospira platensis]